MSKWKACGFEAPVVQPFGLVLQSVLRPTDFLWQIADLPLCERGKKEQLRLQKVLVLVPVISEK